MIIDVYSDTVCPWCFIGKRRLESALRDWRGPAPEIRWRAFQLTPEMPAGGLDRDHYLQLKFGTADASRLFRRVAETGREVGIEFAFERIRRSPNTLDSHRLIRRAAREGCQEAAVEALFRAYFLEGRDIGDRDVLAGIAGGLGMDERAARAWLDTDEDVQEVRDEDAGARDLGIGGVPFYLVGGRFPVTGAQTPDVFLQALERVAGG
ncbi:MAG TPA: DsbA family oxidoreductase [Gammaproteobacteria bacterium]|nr:DsbA family oxidoreductase [Gammaproteobacteria bacterium]